MAVAAVLAASARFTAVTVPEFSALHLNDSITGKSDRGSLLCFLTE